MSKNKKKLKYEFMPTQLLNKYAPTRMSSRTTPVRPRNDFSFEESLTRNRSFKI